MLGWPWPWRRLPRDLGIGLALGAGLFAVVMLVLEGGGWIHLHRSNPHWNLVLPAAVALFVSAAIEELLARGVLLRGLEWAFGSIGAIALSAVIFGALHLSNPHATVGGAVAIALEAGVLLGAAFTWTRALWMPIGIHAGWNIAQLAVFGNVVSGADRPGAHDTFMLATPHGSAIISGGSFGPEASIVAVVVCLIPGVWLVRATIRSGQMRPPMWRRRRRV